MAQVDASYRDAFAITPSDSALIQQQADAIYVGGAGDLTLITEGGNSVKFSGVPAGGLIPFSTQKVLSTGTTATLLLGLVYFPIYGGSGGTGGGVSSDIFITDDAFAALTDDSGVQLTL